MPKTHCGNRCYADWGAFRSGHELGWLRRCEGASKVVWVVRLGESIAGDTPNGPFVTLRKPWQWRPDLHKGVTLVYIGHCATPSDRSLF